MKVLNWDRVAAQTTRYHCCRQSQRQDATAQRAKLQLSGKNYIRFTISNTTVAVLHNDTSRFLPANGFQPPENISLVYIYK